MSEKTTYLAQLVHTVKNLRMDLKRMEAGEDLDEAEFSILARVETASNRIAELFDGSTKATFHRRKAELAKDMAVRCGEEAVETLQKGRS